MEKVPFWAMAKAVINTIAIIENNKRFIKKTIWLKNSGQLKANLHYLNGACMDAPIQ
jgi:hypothetical protein